MSRPWPLFARLAENTEAAFVMGFRYDTVSLRGLWESL